MKKMFLIRGIVLVSLACGLLCGHLEGAEPATPGYALSLHGSSGYVSTANEFDNPPSFTITIWFNTTTTQGGRLLGLGDAQTGLSQNYDRHLYMHNNGHIFFGIYNGGRKIHNQQEQRRTYETHWQYNLHHRRRFRYWTRLGGGTS